MGRSINTGPDKPRAPVMRCLKWTQVESAMAKGVKTGGRAAGTPNKATKEFRQTVTALLEKNAANVDLWLRQVADGHGDNKPDPAKALDLLAKLAEYGAPKLNRTEHTGEGGGPVDHSLTVKFVGQQ